MVHNTQTNQPNQPNQPLVDLTTNIAQIFTELYENYNILDNEPLNVFENALYIEGDQSRSIKTRMNQALQNYHRNEGTMGLYINPNENINNQVFIAGNGSTQLYKGLVYALATSYPDKEFLFVQKIPYFGGHRDAVDKVFNYPNATYQGYDDPSEVNPDTGTIIVEFVTSPNNPTGEFRKPAFKSTLNNPYIILGDFVFTSASFGVTGNGYIDLNLEWLEEYRNDDTLIMSYNSASKQFGHTGDRYGYMWFPMYDEFAAGIFSQLNNFLAITVGSNLQGPSNFLNLLGPLEKEGKLIRKDTNESLKSRSDILSAALTERYPGTLITNVRGSPLMFVKINDSRINLPEVTAADVILADTNVKTVPGSVSGADDTYVRINIMAFSEDLAIFANRLVGNKSYYRDDFLISCSKSNTLTICDNYVTNPGNKKIVVDAYHHDIKVKLPKYLGYEQRQKLVIKRSDDSYHCVKIVSDEFKIKLFPCGYVVLKWSQPFYENGSWEILKIKQGKTRKRREYDYENKKTNKKIIHNKTTKKTAKKIVNIPDVSNLYLV